MVTVPSGMGRLLAPPHSGDSVVVTVTAWPMALLGSPGLMLAVNVVDVISGTSVIADGHVAAPCCVTENAQLSTAPYAPAESPASAHATVQLQAADGSVHAPALAVKLKSAVPDVNDCCGVTSKNVAPSQPVIAAETASPDGTAAGAGVVAVTVHVNVPNCATGS